MEARIIKTGELRAVEGLGEREYEFVISNESVDRHGTVVRAEGLRFDDYEKNPVVAYNHLTWTSDPDTIIGTSKVWKEGAQTIARLTLEPEGENAIADKVAKKLENGTLRAASIGFMAEAGHWGAERDGEDPNVYYFDRASLHEWSVVSVPSNKEALKRSDESVQEYLKEHPKEVERKGMSVETKAKFRKRRNKIHPTDKGE